MFVATKHAEIRLRQRGIPLAVVEMASLLRIFTFRSSSWLSFLFRFSIACSASKRYRQRRVGPLFGTLELLRRSEHKRRGHHGGTQNTKV